MEIELRKLADIRPQQSPRAKRVTGNRVVPDRSGKQDLGDHLQGFRIVPLDSLHEDPANPRK